MSNWYEDWRVVRWRMPGGDAPDDYIYTLRRIDAGYNKIIGEDKLPQAASTVDNLKTIYVAIGEAFNKPVLELMPTRLVEVPQKKKQ